MRLDRRRAFVRVGTRLAIVAFAASACSRSNKVEMEEEPRPEPIPVVVKNENFLDVNVAVLSGGVSRRLGQVSGNGSAEFRLNWNVANGQSISLTATPIGQNARYTSPGFSISPGQMIVVRIASVLYQSTTVVREQ